MEYLEFVGKSIKGVGWDILSILQKSDYLSYSDIRVKLKLAQVKAQVELARLEGACLIEATRSDEDRRAINYSITEYGNQIVKYKR